MRYSILAAIVLAACTPAIPSNPGHGDDTGGGDDGSDTNPGGDGGTQQPTPDAGGGLVAGTMDVQWMHGSPNCNNNADPEVQVHQYNATTYIIRQNKCDTFEAPFVYVLIGTDKALMLDTGDTTTTTLRQTVLPLVNGLPLVVAHTHAHGDHTAGDGTFQGQPNVTVVAKSISAIQSTFGIASWPTDVGSMDLGGRVLDVLGIPGHEAQHIAIYDRQTGILLTGDTLYPGLLFISDWTAYRDSVHRLEAFMAGKPIAYVLGAHIEMTSTPKQNYPYGTTYQPAEHVLQLDGANLEELDDALVSLGASPPNNPVAHDDFVIDPQ